MRISVDFAARLEPEPTAETEALRRLGPLDKPYWHLEGARAGATRRVPVDLVVNGAVRESREVEADGSIRALTLRFTPEGSCWVALRVLGAAHTNPIWITVGGAPVRVAASARWCRGAVDQCWLRKQVRIRPAERIREAALYERARAFYDRAVQESTR